MEDEVEYSFAGLLARYFVHGIAFSILLTLLGIAWAILLVILMIAGAFIGLIIGFILLFIIIGGLNIFLADILWGIVVRGGWKTFLLHGVVLSFILFIVHLPGALVFYAIPNIIALVAISIIAAFADGYVGKALALRLAEESSEDE
jgi:hypothetical protein